MGRRWIKTIKKDHRDNIARQRDAINVNVDALIGEIGKHS